MIERVVFIQYQHFRIHHCIGLAYACTHRIHFFFEFSNLAYTIMPIDGEVAQPHCVPYAIGKKNLVAGSRITCAQREGLRGQFCRSGCGGYVLAF